MKKNLFSMGVILAAALTLTNCTDQIETPVQQPESTGYPFEITASAVKTKTINYNNSMSTEWAADDQINLFHSDADAQEVTYINDGAFTITEENLLEGRFTGELKEALSDDKSYNWYAFYPYTESFSTPGAKVKGYVNVGAKEQVQNGNSNMDHIAGTNFPLAGIANTEGTAKPVIEMSHLASLIKVHVTNKSSEPLTVTNVTFTGTEDIVGTYYINFVDMNGEEGVRYTSSGENYVTAAATLKVMEGASIPVDGTADFYLGIKPFGAKSGATISLQVNTCIKDVVLSRDVNFDAGTINTLNFSYVDPELPKGISAIKKEANADGASFAVTLEDAIVTYVSGSNAYIEDKEAGILIYTNTHGLMAGDKLSGDVTGTVKLYNNLREITAIDLSKAEKTSDNEIPVTTLTLAELNAEGAYDKYENMRIKIEGAEVAGNKITQAGESYEFYLKNKLAAGFVEYNIIDVIGYPTKYNDAIQFNVWEDAEVKGATKTTFIGFNDVVEVVVGGIVANKATASSGATVTYVSDNTEVAIVDEDGNVTGVAEGEAIITASVAAYNGYPAAEKTCTVKVVAENVTKYYVKVTSAPADWSGTYLIVYESDKIALDGSLAKLDAANNFKNVTITDDKIEATVEVNGIAFTITDNKYIKTDSGYYIGSNSTSNTLAASTSTKYENTLSINNDGTAHIVGSKGSVLRYNPTDKRFRYYKSTSYSGQKAIHLYKLN